MKIFNKLWNSKNYSAILRANLFFKNDAMTIVFLIFNFIAFIFKTKYFENLKIYVLWKLKYIL